MAFAIANGGVVNHRVETAERVDLRSDISRARDRLQIASDNGFSLPQRLPGIVRAGFVARVQGDMMALLREKLARPSDPARLMNPR